MLFHSLVALQINAYEEEVQPTLFAVIEKVVDKGFMMHGFFDSLDGAVKSYKVLQKTSSLISVDKNKWLFKSFL